MLGAPPAFVLSQDQTLNLIILKLLYRSNKLFSEQLWRFVQIALLLWITCLDFQKKSGFSFIRIYCLIFKFLVKSHLISHHSYWRISSDSSIGKISLSWKAVFRDSFVIISCRFLFVKRFFEVFLKKFFEKAFSFSTNFSPHFTNSFHQDCASIQFSSYIHVRFELFEFVSHATACL